MAEKRAARRHTRRITVRYGEADLRFTGFATDISQSGVFVAANQLPPLDARVHLELQGPSGPVFREAVVRRHKLVPPVLRSAARQGFGARFLTPEELLSLLVPRAESDAPLQCAFSTAEELQRAFDGQLRHGGLYLQTERAFERDAQVQVEVRLDFASERLRFPARVVQVVPAAGGKAGGVGVLLTDVAATREALTRHLPR
jgi:Tfp pilus assembly protein PilZ